jgi:hypothetical protein
LALGFRVIAIVVTLAALLRAEAAVPRSYSHICATGFSSLNIMNLVCDDDEVGAILERMVEIPLVNVDSSQLFDSRLFDTCKSLDDAKRCLLDGYGKKLHELEAEARRLSRLYEDNDKVVLPESTLQRLSGVYKRRHKYSDWAGPREIENILELVPVSRDAAYIRAELYPASRDSCGVAGIFAFRNIGGFVLQDDAKAGACLLTVSVKDGALSFSDPTGNCQTFCAHHGSWDETFDLKLRREIRYMPRLLVSREYQGAITRYEKRNPDKGQ